jgi:2-dehydropantoate 2-reductase
MEQPPRVAVVGPGAVGSYFGGMLARGGARVTMIGRSGGGAHLAAMAREGLRLATRTFDARVRVETSVDPHAVARADLVLFCVKAVDTDAAARGIAPHVARDSVVLDLQNGVDNPARLRRAGIDPIPAVVYVAAAVEQPGVVIHRGRGDLVIGHCGRAADLERVARWLASAGIGCVVSDDVERELWIKLIANSMANATSALTGATYGALVEHAPTWRLAIEVAREGAAVARTEGHALDPDELVARSLAICRAVAGATSSTQQDLARGRPTEIDALNGYLARAGAERGIPVPVNQALSALVKLRERTDGSR